MTNSYESDRGIPAGLGFTAVPLVMITMQRRP
jgi:hypothetical protein